MKVLANRFITVQLVALLLSACAATPPPQHQNLRAETDDLAMVTSWALTMADTFGRENLLVVFDIDNTLLAMEQGLGSDQWYYWQKSLAEEQPCSDLLVPNRFAVQGAVFFASAMRPTQADAAEQLRAIQDAGIRVIAVTSRGTEYQLQTFRELRRHDMSFWPTSLPPRRGWPETFVPQGAERPTLYQDGVFLTSGQHKGVMLDALLRMTGTPRPGIILIADDKRENLEAMMETFDGTGTSVHAWRYTREDANVAAFDGDKAALQWRTLEPALQVIQGTLGPDNFELPESSELAGCP